MTDYEKFQKDLEILIRARYPIILCETYEESRLLKVLQNLSASRSMNLVEWSCTRGFYDHATNKSDGNTNPEKALSALGDKNGDCIFALKDFSPYLKDPTIQRRLRDIAKAFKLCQKTIVLISTNSSIPETLQKDISLLPMPLPGREDMRQILSDIETSDFSVEKAEVDFATEAALGLTYDEAENAFAKSLVEHGHLDAKAILEEKRQIVKKSGILEYVDLSISYDSIGGLENLKHWLGTRKRGLSEDARARSLPPPKGILLVGLPGCGKSLTAQCTGLAWQMPVLRLDIGKVFAGLVGSSEANMRQALSTCEMVSPCVLWIDEIEKAFASVSGGGDSGTSARVFGNFLTWMQEKRSSVFVIATANDISQLPPEMLRKGRFDEVFFVDLPNSKERLEVLKIHLRRRKWTIDDIEADQFIQLSEGMSGAEIEQAVIDGGYEAFFYDQELSFKQLVAALKRTVPLSRTMKERFTVLRSWASERAVMASRTEEQISERPELKKRKVDFAPEATLQ